MAVIYAPNKEYTGISAGVSFLNGKGETDNTRLLKWFAKHGYQVENVEKTGKKSKVSI